MKLDFNTIINTALGVLLAAIIYKVIDKLFLDEMVEKIGGE